MGLPFSRARAMFTLIAAAMASANLQVAIAGIAPYKSRGKGRAMAFDKQRFVNPRSKYVPHQGKQECARRIRQMEARA